MKRHLLFTFVCIIVSFNFQLESVVSDAALAPELYWKSKLPNTTIPKAVKDLLRAGKVEKTIHDQLRDDPNKQIWFWRHATNDQLLSLLVQWYAINDQLRDNLNRQIWFWRHVTNDQLRDDPNIPLFGWGHATNDQFHDDPNKQLFRWMHTNNDQLHDDPNKQLFGWGHATNKQLHDDLNKQFFGRGHATNDQFRDDPNKQLFRWGHTNNDQFHNDPNKQLFGWGHVINDQLHDDPNKQLFHRGHTINYQFHEDSNKQLFGWGHATNNQLRDDPNKLFVWQHATNEQLHNNPMTTDDLHDDSSKYLFLSEDDLHPGKKLEMLFTKSPYSTTLLPREVSETIPFSVEEVPELLKMFSIKPGSKEAHIIKSTIHHCEEPPMITGEEKHCVTSLESMVDYITSKLGINVKAYSTEVEKESHLQTYTIASGVKKISDEVMACHQTHYPYALFRCHKVGGSNRAYFVPLEGFDGTRVKAIAVCHLDTSDWDPNHLAFQVLKIKPGNAPVCHFSPTDNIIWTPNMAI